jgi:hypothetical protein
MVLPTPSATDARGDRAPASYEHACSTTVVSLLRIVAALAIDITLAGREPRDATGDVNAAASLRLSPMTYDREQEVWGKKDGRAWRIGVEAEVAWIRENTEVSFAITSAIPPVFEAYATLELPGSGDHLAASPLEDHDRHNASVLAVLREHSVAQPWWLGYLETGIADIVFPDVPKVRPGPTNDAWYVLVEAGPGQAGGWREREQSAGLLPDLMFPADRSWLLSTLWDDDWTCIGGSRGLVDAFLTHPDLRHRAREVDLSVQDATPRGHTAI